MRPRSDYQMVVQWKMLRHSDNHMQWESLKEAGNSKVRLGFPLRAMRRFRPLLQVTAWKYGEGQQITAREWKPVAPTPQRYFDHAYNKRLNVSSVYRPTASEAAVTMQVKRYIKNMRHSLHVHAFADVKHWARMENTACHKLSKKIKKES